MPSWLLAPNNTQVKAYPYNEDHNFGPYGLSFADDSWEMRTALKIRMIPKNEDHPYHHKDLYRARTPAGLAPQPSLGRK